MSKPSRSLPSSRLGHWASGKASGFLQKPALALSAISILMLPSWARGSLLPQQNISGNISVPFCGFHSIQRYKTWCESPISAFVASNTSCQQYGVCSPLSGDEAMTCMRSTFCSGWRPQGTSEAACLVLLSEAQGDSVVLCDVEIEGSSLSYSPPPSTAPPSDGANSSPNWALWKTMAIIWSILGFAALLVVVVLLIRWLLKGRALASSTSPVTALSADDRLQIELAARGEMPPAGSGGGAHATVTLLPTAPDGKPILAYGAAYPPPPVLTPTSSSALAAAMMATATAGGTRLPPNAGDAILRAAADSRPAYNGPPMRAPAVVIPPLMGITPPPPPPLLSESAFTGAGAHSAVAAEALLPLPYNSSMPSATELPPLLPPPLPLPLAPSAGLMGSEGLVDVRAGDEALPVVTPAALVPPPAATLQNPRLSL